MTFPRASRLSLTTLAILLSVTVGANATPSQEPVAAQTAGDPIATAIDEASRRFGIPEAWIRAVMRVESNGDRRAVSRAGAMGLMQVMPATYADLRRQLGIGADPFDVRDNILAGTAYLRQMYDRYGAPGFWRPIMLGQGAGKVTSTEAVPYLTRPSIICRGWPRRSDSPPSIAPANLLPGAHLPLRGPIIRAR